MDVFLISHIWITSARTRGVLDLIVATNGGEQLILRNSPVFCFLQVPISLPVLNTYILSSEYKYIITNLLTFEFNVQL